MKHPFWHHLFMVFYSELINILWLGVAVVLALSGWVIFSVTFEDIYRLGVGLPLAAVGVSVFLFKFYEVILVIVRPKRLAKICKICLKNHE